MEDPREKENREGIPILLGAVLGAVIAMATGEPGRGFPLLSYLVWWGIVWWASRMIIKAARGGK